MSDRTKLALPIDVARLFDSTVSQAQIEADTFQNTKTGDVDLLESFIEDAEDEFHDATNAKMRIGREGVAGARETYEQLTYDISGHEQYKRSWAGVAGNYRNTERVTDLANRRILPFDAAEGDQAYIYRGMAGGTGASGEWEDVTDQRGELWDIINHRDGRVVISPTELARTLRTSNQGLSLAGRKRLREVRMAISYRYGGLGGSRNTTSETTLSAQLSDSQTGVVSVADGANFPGTSEIVVSIGREYLSIRPQPDTDEMDILERGIRGTQAVAHDADSIIHYAPPAVRKAVASRAAENLATSSRYQKWLPDNEDDISKDDMIDQFSNTWDTTIAALS